jgi:RNA polymerase sigma-70 factor (ECF subfamily)
MGKLVPLRRVEGAVHELSDEALVSAAGAEDPVALGALFDRFSGDVYRFLHRVCGGDTAELDDLVQTTFLEVYRAAPRFRRRSAVKTWIFGIAVNVSRHHARGETRRRAALARFAEAPGGAAPRPDDATERAELLARLADALAALPEPLRVAYVMCVLEEVPAREAALALGVREGSVWRRVHEAREALRAALGERRGS